MPLIRDYIAEHESVLALGMEAVRQVGRGEFPAAQASVARMRTELVAHWQGEENGVFALLRSDPMYAEHIDPLIAEHRELEALLATLDLAREDHREVLREQVEELRVHISKEEDGIFPVTLVELSGPEWDVAIEAWQQAHPGASLITD